MEAKQSEGLFCTILQGHKGQTTQLQPHPSPTETEKKLRRADVSLRPPSAPLAQLSEAISAIAFGSDRSGAAGKPGVGGVQLALRGGRVHGMRSGKGPGCRSEGRRAEGSSGGGWMSYLKALDQKKTPPFLKKNCKVPTPPLPNTHTSSTHFHMSAPAASLYLRNYRSSVSFPDPPPTGPCKWSREQSMRNVQGSTSRSAPAAPLLCTKSSVFWKI